MSEGIVLGHHLSFRGIEVDKSKIKIIKHLPTPQIQKDVRSFMGHVGHYIRFIKDFSKLASPLFIFLSKDIELCWTTECQKKIECIKQNLITPHVLQGPRWDIPFHVHIDA